MNPTLFAIARFLQISTLAAACLLGSAASLTAHAQDAKPVEPVAAGAAPTSALATPATIASAKAKPSLDKEANPYGLASLWTQSDLVAKLVLLLLVIMSMGSWYVIVAKLIEQARMGAQAKKADAEFWSADTVRAGAEKLPAGSPFRFIADAGLDASKKHSGLHARVDFADWIDMSIHRATERVQRRLSNGMSVLATVGSTSPFVGLFGTVWGIYHALTAIGIAGQASIDKVAGPVGESLIMTAIGLAVAVPAVLGYNWLLRRNVAVMDDVRDFAAELQTVMLASKPAA